MSLFKRGAILGASQGVNVLLTLVTRLLFARLLNTDLYGNYSAALQSMTLLSRGANMGLAPSAQFHASKKDEPLGAVLGVTIVWTLVLAALATVAGWAWVRFGGGFDHPATNQAFLSLVMLLPVVMLTVVLSVVLVPIGRVKEFGITQAGGMIPMLIVTVVALQFMAPLMAIVFGQIATWLYLLGFILWHLRDHLKNIRYDRAVAKKIIQYGLSSWPNLFLTVAVTRATIVLSSPHLTAQELSIFALAIQLAEGLLAPYGALGQLMLTETAQRGHASRDSVARLLRLSSLFFLVLLGIAAVGGPLVLGIAGPNYSASYLPLLALLFVTSLHSRFRTEANVLGGLGQPNAATVPLAVELVVLVGLIWVLGQQMGLVGVILACAAGAIVSWIMLEHKVRAALQLRWRDLLITRREDVAALRDRAKLSRPKSE